MHESCCILLHLEGYDGSMICNGVERGWVVWLARGRFGESLEKRDDDDT